MINSWDELYFNVIKTMLNKATNISDSEHVANYRCFDIRFNYNLNLGFPLLTSKKIDFNLTKDSVENLINDLDKKTIDNVSNKIINNKSALIELKLNKHLKVYLEKAKNCLTMVVNEFDDNVIHIPEKIAVYALLLLIIGKTVEIKDLALQINYVFCRMEDKEICKLKNLLLKEIFKLPTVVLDKQISLYNYNKNYVVLKNYKYSE